MKKLYPVLLVLLSFACVEDDNLPLTNRYFRTAEILQLPQVQYDADNSPPDLRIDLKRRSATFWEFSTDTENNAGTLPTFMVFPAEILATDEVYEIRIVDEDLNQPDDDEIFFWTFHAMDDGEGGAVEFFDDNRLIMVLEFNEK